MFRPALRRGHGRQPTRKGPNLRGFGPSATCSSGSGDKLGRFMSLDLLVFGPHPDDLEIGLAGTIARHVAEGYSVGLCDLTAGELGSNGTPDERRAEAEEAAGVLGVKWRENLGWPDGAITGDFVPSAVDLIRRHRPRTIAIPYGEDRHPDHVAAHHTLTVATFRSGLRRVLTKAEPWRPEWVCSY